MNRQEALFHYALQMGDNALIIGQRLSEWCGHGPVLEQDIAITNIALDQVGQARSWLQYAAELEGKGRSEDDLAYLRPEFEYRNVLLVEQPNTDWAYTIVRQFLFDTFNFYLHAELQHSTDSGIASIAEKSLKEITYHLRFSSEWVIRLGDGTAVSHRKMQQALDDLWMFTGELVEMNELETGLASSGIVPDLEKIKPLFEARVAKILEEATLIKPESPYMQKGGKQGLHSEYMGFILAEMQSLQRQHPGLKW
ncbi:MAG: phenylacetate-CoA oxygenase subunit PaaC [Saprospirales bacterium]|nr:phenylacetate-CoA oxygenase subunit PaaC [Saprospirales bacterium]